MVFEKKVVEVFLNHLGENLTSLVLFGSYARGEAKERSDLDILLIAKELPLKPLKRNAYVYEILSTEFEENVSILAKTEREFESGFPPIYLDLGLDGKILFDRERFMERRLNKIKEIIQQAGLQRVYSENGFSWEWKRQPRIPWRIDWSGFYEFSG